MKNKKGLNRERKFRANCMLKNLIISTEREYYSPYHSSCRQSKTLRMP